MSENGTVLTRVHEKYDRLVDAGISLAYPPRVGEEHIRHARAYRDQPDEESQAEYFQEHNARYFELSRLPYFDPVRMSILDPMHNILLGTCCIGLFVDQ